jgi:hypothetical protein
MTPDNKFLFAIVRLSGSRILMLTQLFIQAGFDTIIIKSSPFVTSNFQFPPFGMANREFGMAGGEVPVVADEELRPDVNDTKREPSSFKGRCRDLTETMEPTEKALNGNER